MEEPFSSLAFEVGELSKRREVAFCDAFAVWLEFLFEASGFLSAVETGGGKAAEDDVGGDEVNKDESTLFRALGMTLVVGSLKSELGAVKVIVREVIATKIIQECYALESGGDC